MTLGMTKKSLHTVSTGITRVRHNAPSAAVGWWLSTIRGLRRVLNRVPQNLVTLRALGSD